MLNYQRVLLGITGLSLLLGITGLSLLYSCLLFLFLLLLLGITGLSSIIIQNYPLLSMNRPPVAAVPIENILGRRLSKANLSIVGTYYVQQEMILRNIMCIYINRSDVCSVYK